MEPFEIIDLDQTVVMIAMKGGLRPFIFFFSLKKRFPTDYMEMLVRAEKYANAEEGMAVRKEAVPNRAKKKEKRKREDLSDKGRAPQPKNSSSLPPQKFKEYIPLSAPQYQILMEVKD